MLFQQTSSDAQTSWCFCPGRLCLSWNLLKQSFSTFFLRANVSGQVSLDCLSLSLSALHVICPSFLSFLDVSVCATAVSKDLRVQRDTHNNASIRHSLSSLQWKVSVDPDGIVSLWFNCCCTFGRQPSLISVSCKWRASHPYCTHMYTLPPV